MNTESDYEPRPAQEQEKDGHSKIKADVMAAIVVMLVGAFLLLKTTGLLPPGLAISFWAVVLVCAGVVQFFTSKGAMRGWGLVMLVAGLVLEMNAMGVTNIHMRNIWPVFLIGAGGLMLWQAMSGGGSAWKILTSSGSSAKESAEPGSLDLNYIFSGTDRKVRTKSFRGGTINAVFGGFKLDLSRAEMEGDKAVLEANAVFGGGEIIVPESWLVVMETTGIFGGFEDKSRHYQPDAAQPFKTIVIRGSAVFGGVVVSND